MNIAKNTESICRIAASLRLAAVVTVAPENFAYVSGRYLMTAKEVRERLALAVVLPDSSVHLIVCSLEGGALSGLAPDYNVRFYREFEQDPIELLAVLLGDLDLGDGPIGIDLDYLAASSCDRLRYRLPRLRMVNTSAEMAICRSIKSQEDASLICRAARSTHRAVLDALAESDCGDSEREICIRIANNMLLHGADTTHFLFLGSGKRSGALHLPGSSEKVLEGEIIHLDVGALYNGISTDFARTYVAGNPTADQQSHYQAVRSVQQAVIAALEPETIAEDVYFHCRDELAARGLELSIPLVGHSLGREIHERPILRPGEKTRLKPGMFLNIEPAVWDDAGSLYHLEDLVEITERGAAVRSLGLAPTELPRIGQVVPS